MVDESTTTSRSFAALFFLVVIVGVSAAVPLAPKKYLNGSVDKIDLAAVIAAGRDPDDLNDDGVVTMGEMIRSLFKGATSTLEEINKQPLDKETIARLNDPNNLTASLSKNILVASVQNEGVIDDTTRDTLLAQMLQTEASKIQPTTYKVTDLHIVKGGGEATLKEYGNTIAPLVKTFISSDVITKDVTDVNNFSKSQNTNDLRNIRKNLTRVDTLITKMLAVKVPLSVVPLHLDIVNRLAEYRDFLYGVSRADVDPVRSMIMLQGYSELVIIVLRIPIHVTTFFDSQNIVFTDKEPGYIFTTGYTYN